MVNTRLQGRLQRRQLHWVGAGRRVRVHTAVEHERQRRSVRQVKTLERLPSLLLPLPFFDWLWAWLAFASPALSS